MIRDASRDLERTLRGERPEPNWTFFLNPECFTTLSFEEAETHPDQVPLLRLANLNGDDVLGQVWFYPEDLPDLIALLQDQLEYFRLQPGEERLEQLDLLAPSEPRMRRPTRPARQYYGDVP